MIKIAMLNCLHANTVCTGASCLKAFHEKTGAFDKYEQQEIQLDAFMKCNGCGKDPKLDIGMQEKIQRLKRIGTQIVHIGICTKQKDGKECPAITTIAAMLEEQGIQVVRGTHV